MLWRRCRKKSNFESDILNHFFTDANYIRTVSRGGRHLSSVIIITEEVHMSAFMAIKDIILCSNPFRLRTKEVLPRDKGNAEPNLRLLCNWLHHPCFPQPTSLSWSGLFLQCHGMVNMPELCVLHQSPPHGLLHSTGDLTRAG